MNQSQLVAMQLQRRDPTAWTALLRECLNAEDVVVTAVSAEPIHYPSQRSKLTRYLLALDNHTDPIALIGKNTDANEIAFYQHLACRVPHLAPRCWFIHPPVENRDGWLLLDEVPNNILPEKWSINDVDDVIAKMADLHAAFWQQTDSLLDQGFSPLFAPKTYTFKQLQAENPLLFKSGPGAVLSEHAVSAAGALTPKLLKAANGVAVMRALGGWPGILGETHLQLAADLLDDPLPMLEPLRTLPVSLLHGSPHTYHWMITLFEDLRLLDWHQTAVGPGICDLVSFLEQFDVISDRNVHGQGRIRGEWPVSEETIIDNYILGMKRRLGNKYNGRLHRNAIPAARCLYTLTNWFTFFAEWADDMPNHFTWQKINRMPAEEVLGTPYEPFVSYRPYLSTVFNRFLLACRSL